jgi:hypothetical protein
VRDANPSACLLIRCSRAVGEEENAEEASKFIEELFEATNKSGKTVRRPPVLFASPDATRVIMQIFVHQTCATDTRNVERVSASVSWRVLTFLLLSGV